MLRFNYRPISILKTSLLLSTGFLLLAHLLEARPPSRRAQEKGFLEENAKQPGIVTTKSGLQYQILKEGKGTEFPKRRDTVSIHFQGSLIDGTVFESTRNRENPISMRLSKAVSGYSEAIQLMNIGDQYRFYIPSKLAYGSSKQGEIPPYSVLIFEIELFDIKKK